MLHEIVWAVAIVLGVINLILLSVRAFFSPHETPCPCAHCYLQRVYADLYPCIWEKQKNGSRHVSRAMEVFDDERA